MTEQQIREMVEEVEGRGVAQAEYRGRMFAVLEDEWGYPMYDTWKPGQGPLDFKQAFYDEGTEWSVVIRAAIAMIDKLEDA